jgi:hypothetical protein
LNAVHSKSSQRIGHRKSEPRIAPPILSYQPPFFSEE